MLSWRNRQASLAMAIFRCHALMLTGKLASLSAECHNYDHCGCAHQVKIVLTRKQTEQEVGEFVQAVGLLIRRVRAATSSDKLSLSEEMVMSRLAQGGPATTADLARAEGIKPQSMRTIVSTLEELNMIERVPHPTDGRQVNIRLTAHGIATRGNRKEAKQKWLNNAISTLNKEEQDTLFAAGKIMKRLVDLDL